MKRLLVALTLIAACAAPTKAVARRDKVMDVRRAFHATVALETTRGDVFCSGVIVDHKVLTAYHCIDSGRRVFVNGADGRWEAALLATDKVNDLATLLPVDGRKLRKGVALGRRAPTWGADIWVIGHPLGTYEYSITKGIVSHPHRENGIFGGKWMQHDAGTAGGNSGGPVLNKRGSLVGITSFGVLNGLYCVVACPGVYQDTHLAGAVHLDPIKQILHY